MKFRKLITNQQALIKLLNDVNDKKECKLTHIPTILQLALISSKIQKAMKLYEQMERGVRQKLKHLIENLPKDQNDRGIIIQDYNDQVADKKDEIFNTEIPAECELDKIDEIEYKHIAELRLTPAILGSLIDFGLINMEKLQ